jgi:adenylate cyclase
MPLKTVSAGGNGLRYLFEDCVLDTDRRELRRGEAVVPLTPQALDLLDYLIRNRDRVVSKDDLIAAVWEGRIVSDAAVTTRINAARSAIGDSGEEQRLIRTLPRKGFRFVGAVREEQGPVTEAPASMDAPRPALALPLKPSIAVLPFANLNADPEQEYFADGIVADIITELSRFSELFVIARNSSFQYKGKAVDVRQIGRELGVRYVLEGSVRRSGDRLRISAQLIDAATGAHRWAEHYDRNLKEVFAVQDEVVHTIVAILAAHVRKAETERARAKPPDSWQAHDYYMQATEVFGFFTSSGIVEELREARHLVQRSLAIDANYARAHALLAKMLATDYWSHYSDRFLDPEVLAQAHQAARRAVQLDANLPEAHACLGLVLAWKRQHDASVAAFEGAVALNPNYVDWRFGFALVLAGDSRRAAGVLNACMRLDPFYSPLASGLLGLAHYMLEQYEQGLPFHLDCVSRAPGFMHGHASLAATLSQLGQLDEARGEVTEVLRLRPDYTIGKARRVLGFKSAKDQKHYFDALRRAGLPD